REDALAFGVIAGPLLVVERAAEHQQPCLAVAIGRARTEAFGEPSLALAPPQRELPEAFLPHHVARREEEVIYVLRVDVRHAPLVANHLDRLADAADDDV